MVNLSLESQISGLFTLLALPFLFIVSGIALKRALRYREKSLFFFFLTVLFAFSPWWPAAFSYLYWLFTNELLSYEFNVFVGMAFAPIAIISWLDIYLNALKPKLEKPLVGALIVFSLIFEIYLIYFLFLAPGAPVQPLLGEVNELRTNFTGFVLIYSLIAGPLVSILGIHFAIVSIRKIKSKETQMKGKFLLAGFSLFTLLLVLDTIFPYTLIAGIIIIRILLIFSAVFLYVGFILPKWAKRLLSLEDNS